MSAAEVFEALFWVAMLVVVVLDQRSRAYHSGWKTGFDEAQAILRKEVRR